MKTSLTLALVAALGLGGCGAAIDNEIIVAHTKYCTDHGMGAEQLLTQSRAVWKVVCRPTEFDMSRCTLIPGSPQQTEVPFYFTCPYEKDHATNEGAK